MASRKIQAKIANMLRRPNARTAEYKNWGAKHYLNVRKAKLPNPGKKDITYKVNIKRGPRANQTYTKIKRGKDTADHIRKIGEYDTNRTERYEAANRIRYARREQKQAKGIPTSLSKDRKSAIALTKALGLRK